jgi:hypothetical protein
MHFRACRWAAVTSALFSFLLATSATQASVVLLDTLSGTPSTTAYSIFNPGFEPGQSVAVSFMSNNAWTITSIDTSISAQFGSVTLDLGIMADSGGRPSGTFLSSVTIDASTDPVSLTSLDWSIDNGAKYWFAAIAHNDDAQWVGSQIQGTFGFASGDTWMTESGPLPGALIRADLTSATPLPGAFALFASGLGGFGLFGLRRKRKETFGTAA